MAQKYVCSWQSAEVIIITLQLHSVMINIVLCIEFNKFSHTKEKL
jgi:hypothetical protein